MWISKIFTYELLDDLVLYLQAFLLDLHIISSIINVYPVDVHAAGKYCGAEE